MRYILLLLSILMSLTGSQVVAGEPATVEHYAAGTDSERKLPFSDAVRVGNLLYLSGKIGNVGGTMELAPGGIQAETRQTLENIKASLERMGSSMAVVV